MRRFTVSLAFVLYSAAAAGCSAGGETRSDTDGAGCMPGQQVSCACPGGGEGVQICEADGSAFGVCMGCDDASSGSSTSVVDDSTTDTTGTTPMDSSGPMMEEGA